MAEEWPGDRGLEWLSGQVASEGAAKCLANSSDGRAE